MEEEPDGLFREADSEEEGIQDNIIKFDDP